MKCCGFDLLEIEEKGIDEKFQSVLDSINDGFVIQDKKGDITFANNKFYSILGNSTNEIIGHSLTDFIHESNNKIIGKEIQKQRKENNIKSEIVLKNKSGEQIETLATFLPIFNQNKSYDGSFIIFSERKRGLDVELYNKLEDLILINSLNESINRGESLKKIFNIIFKWTKDNFNSYGATVYLLSEDKKHLVLQKEMINSDVEKKIERIIGMKISEVKIPLIDGSYHLNVLKDGKSELVNCPVTIQKIMTEHTENRVLLKLIPRIFKNLGIKSVINVPLISEDAPIGLLSISRKFPFTDSELHRLNLISEELTVAIKKKIIEEILDEKEEIFKKFFENSPDFCYMISPEGNIVNINKCALEVLGYHKKEVIGKPLIPTVYSPSSREKVKKIFEKWKKKGIVKNEELEIITKYGTDRKVLLSVDSIFDKSGKLKYSISIQRDITERNLAYEAIKKSEEKYRNLTDSISAVIYRADPETSLCTFINKAVEEIYGYSADEWLSNSKFWENTIHPEDKEMVFFKLEKAIKTLEKTSIQYRIITKDGNIKWLEDRFGWETDQNGKPVSTNGIAYDITDRKKLEDTIRHEKDKAQEYLDVASVILIAIDRNQNVTLINRRGCELLGHDEKEIIGRNWFDNFIPEKIREEMKNYFSKIITGDFEGIEIYENPILTSDGEERIIEWHNTKLKDEKSNIIGIISSGEDITDRKLAEEALKLDEERFKALFDLAQMKVETEKELIVFALEEGVRLTGSNFGYLHFVSDDQKSINLHTWSKEVLKQCTAEKNPHYPIDKAGVWADCIRKKRPEIHNDYQKLPEKRGYPEGHCQVKRHLSIPVFHGNKIVAVLGVGNKKEPYNDSDIQQLSLFTNSMWRLLEQKRTEDALKEHEEKYKEQLEKTVDERTNEIKKLKEFNENIVQRMEEGIIIENEDGIITCIYPFYEVHPQ